MGGKGGTVQAPDYGPIGAANEESAKLSAEVAREQLAWAKEQYASDRGVSDQIVNQFLGTMKSEATAAAADRERYQKVFQPIEDRFAKDSIADRDRYEKTFRPLEDQYVQDAQADRDRYRSNTVPLEDALAKDAASYNDGARAEQDAGRAASGVAQAFEGARKGALANLESYGVDPSQTRAGALDLAVRTSQAASAANASNNARLQSENTGRQLRMDAINVGRASGVDALARAGALGTGLQGSIGNAVNVGKGYPGQVASAYQTSQGAGSGAIQSQLGTTGSGASTMGTGVQWQGLNNQALGQWGNQVTALNQSATQANTQRSAQQQQGIGSLVGGIAGLALSPSAGFGKTLVGSLFQPRA
jgi:hypothetical protein